MIWNFGRNLKEDKPTKVVEQQPPAKGEDIIFRSTDSTYTRARNIWWALGFQSDSIMIASLTGFLSVYRDLDEDVKRKEQDDQDDTEEA
jgi:hypothetical protein